MTEDKRPGGFSFRPETDFGRPVSSPVWPDAAAGMKIDVCVNADSAVWVIHDKPFPDYLEWVEFDADTRVMTFVTANGKIQDLGLAIHPPMDAYVARARQVCTIWMKDGRIADMGLVSLTVRSLSFPEK